jgi:PKD repeat protein
MRRLLLLPIAALLLALGAASASADSQAQPFQHAYHGFTGDLDLFTFSAVCDECFDDDFDLDAGSSGLGTSVGVDGNFSWHAATDSLLIYDTADVRQGSTVQAVTSTFALPGSATVNYHFYGKMGLFNDPDMDGPGPWNPTNVTVGVDTWLTSTIPCSLPLDGGHHVCQKEERFELATIAVPPFAQFKLVLRVTTTVTMDSTGVVGVRVASVDAGLPIPDAPVSFFGTNAGTFIDPVFVSCLQPEGEMLRYSLNDMHLGASDVTLNHSIDIVFAIYDPLGVDMLEEISTPNLNLAGPVNFGSVEMLPEVDDLEFELGEVQGDATPPTIEDLGFFIGWEGSPIQLEADADDNCGAPTLRWDFSDGGVAFGPSPEHVFADNGLYPGLLTATDVHGLTTTTTFSVTVLNAAPSANAGPDALEAWGVQVPFNGQAVDPGAADQGTLSYEWDFGDNSPKGHAEDTTHAYSTPGTYVATLKVCDKEGSCDTDSREITIRKRNTSAGYVGAQTWTYDTMAALSASLVDEFGQPVNGRSIGFSVNGEYAGVASTGSNGIAMRGHQVTQMAGMFEVLAQFGGDALYSPASATDEVLVLKKPTTLTYTGTLQGGPNKVVALSASLKDSDGKPLAGRTVTFQLGTQTATAVTDSNGVATTTLQLSQKNGTVSLLTTWTPVASDFDRFTPASDVDTFAIGTSGGGGGKKK